MTGTASHTGWTRPAAAVSAGRRGVPARTDAAVFAMLSAVLATCVAALGLALIGAFRWWAVPPTAAICAGALWLLRPRSAATPAGIGGNELNWAQQVGRAPLVVALIVAAVVTGVNLALPSELLLSGRDGGTYTNTAAWLAHDGDLVIETRPGSFAEANDLEYRVAGFQQVRGADDLYPQFIHTFPALMATAAGVAGLEGMLWVNPVLSGLALLSVFAFATRLLHPWTAVLVTVALAVNLVFTYYSRAPFTEILALLFAFGGLWTLDLARVTGSRRTSLMAGLLLGATALARLDGLVITLLVLGLAALRIAGRRHNRAADAGVRWPALAAGAVMSAGAAVLDMAVYSPFYLTMHTDYLLPLLAAAVVLPVGAVVAAGSPGRRIWSWVRAHRGQLALAAAVVVVLGAAYAVALRPALEYATWERTTPIGGLQDAAGHPVDEHRTYAEQTMRWLLWYMGPGALVAGLAGWAGLTARAVRGRAPAAVPFLVVFGGMTVLYLWRPSITPDHIWAMRRFLTVSIPGLLILAAWSVEWLVRRYRPRRDVRRAAIGAAALSAVAVVAGGAIVTAPVATVNELDGVAAGWERLCGRLGDDAAVLVLEGDFTPWATTQGFRSFCDVPAAHGGPTPARTAELARSWAAEDRRLVVVGSDVAAIELAAGTTAQELVDVRYSQLERALVRAPSRLIDGRWHLYAAEVDG